MLRAFVCGVYDSGENSFCAAFLRGTGNAAAESGKLNLSRSCQSIKKSIVNYNINMPQGGELLYE